MLSLIHIPEGYRMFRRAGRIRRDGYMKYPGSAAEICLQIIEHCWNREKKYFQVSRGNYPEFYCRDFGICTAALIRLGQKNKVAMTLEYALDTFARHGKITQIISPNGKPFEFPSFSSDALPFLLRSLNLAGARDLIMKHKDFLNKEIMKYYKRVYDPKTGLVKPDRNISGMKDYALRVSPCYHNCMMAMLAGEIGKAKLNNPFRGMNFKKRIKDNFWKKTHFIDDLSGNNAITGDANVFPFWCGIFTEKKMLKSVIQTMRRNELDYPVPLRYFHKKTREHDMIWQNIFAGDWEHDACWLHLGMCYLDIVKEGDSKMYAFYLDKVSGIVEHYQNFYEVLEPNGKPLMGRFYCSDDGMLWSSMLLRHLVGA